MTYHTSQYNKNDTILPNIIIPVQYKEYVEDQWDITSSRGWTKNLRCFLEGPKQEPIIDPSPIKKKKVYLWKKKKILAKNRISNFFILPKKRYFRYNG